MNAYGPWGAAHIDEWVRWCIRTQHPFAVFADQFGLYWIQWRNP